MHCNARTMIKIAVALGGILAAAYVALPEAREFVAASAPVLLALICPISMGVMMFMMRSRGGTASRASAEPSQPPAAQQPLAEAPPARAKEATAP